MRERETTKERSVGRWKSILSAFGLTQQQLSGKHGPCPVCGGRDRFRFDDKGGNGTWFCNQCGAGDGIGLVMRLKRVAFKEACQSIESYIPGAAVATRSATSKVDWEARGLDLWAQCRPLDGSDTASLYLRRRGILPTRQPMLRHAPRYGYVHEDRHKTTHPAMVARYVSPDATHSTFHITYLDASGRKADVPSVKKLWPGRVPDGGAVRLAPSADTMGIAEGIETAMSAAQLFSVPVWAALNSGNLMKWQPPETARNIIVFGDRDESFDGQCKAYALAHRLKLSGLSVEVRLPDFDGDWNDYLTSFDAPRAEAAE
jgi:putative DNA primase/helicase